MTGVQTCALPICASGNWDWRFTGGALRDELAEDLKELTVLYGRHVLRDTPEDTEDGPQEEVLPAKDSPTGEETPANENSLTEDNSRTGGIVR